MTTHTRRRRATAAERAQAAHALLSAVIELGEATTDDAHVRYELPGSVDQRVWGAVTLSLVADGVLCRIGDQHTRRAVAHGRRIGEYVAPDTDRAICRRDVLAERAARKRTFQPSLPGLG